MTLWVLCAVSAVAIVIMVIGASFLRSEYEREVEDNLSRDIQATTTVLDQRIRRMESVTKAAASVLETKLQYADNDEIDSVLSKLLKDVELIDVVTLAIGGDDGMATIHSGYREIESRKIVVQPALSKSLADDLNWIKSYEEGQQFWCVPFIPVSNPEARLQCYSVPIYDKAGRRCGILCTMIEERWIAKMIKKYKTRPDIDVSIYNRRDSMVVEPDEYIRELPPEDLIVVSRQIDHLGWRMVFSMDKHVVTEKLSSLVWQLVIMVVILLVAMTVAITLTVKYVAQPFMAHQNETLRVKAAMERELQIAADTQQHLVPHQFPPFPERQDISIHACLRTAREVGGDLYDYFIDRSILYFCIGDVSGKGVPASLFMAATHYLFRSVAAAMPIAEAVEQMNRSLCIDNEKCNFVTFFFARLDLATGMLEYCNAGHNPPVLVQEGEAKLFAESDGMPLGVWDEAEYESHHLQMGKGDLLLLYTDGVTEAMNPAGQEFGTDVTLRHVQECCTQEPRQIIENLLRAVQQHADKAPQSDDITMLCLKINN